MAFDSQTRNKLQRMVGACRRLLADEFDDQLQGLYGIYAQDGRVLELEKLTSLDDDHHQTASLLRDRINHLTSGMASEKQPLAEAVRRVLREQAFTLLNRFAALRMAEERGFVQECVGQGLKSKGFQVFETVAHSGLGGAYERYVTFIHGMFDELSLDLGVLFDRWSPFGLLFPREPALLKFFDRLNDLELKPLWKEDETIGWIYQYFNDEAERKKMREESSAPRNSRELAVRNQFFTPRYVVEFLTDNTLGRIWYEMTQGETKLKEQCRYLVRRPNEIFLKPGEKAPEQPKQDNLSQENLLKQPVFIPHRPIKDPRTILMLDPACGSMHFGLYAFDLFEVIYEEAWELEKRGAEFQSRPPATLSLYETYGTKEDFLKDVPRLTIEHNLHGIDIDPRCAQIAGLSLWLRAQKAWHRLGLKPAERPPIKRSNIVCAEPMPGEKELLREFVEREFPAEERGVCLRLLEAIFDKMQLAGEAGSLLKIEEEIRTAIEDARRQWQTARQRPEFFDTAQLATLDKRAGAQQELPAAHAALLISDLRLLTSEVFWERIEERIYAALRDYAEQAENGGGFQRRLFAEDAARGFAFIDVCRKRYDVALMNPPFGSIPINPRLEASMPHASADNLYAAFVLRSANLLCEGGMVGCISDRTFLLLPTYQEYRDLLREYGLRGVADLGWEVLDGAQVATCAYVVASHLRKRAEDIWFVDARESSDKENVVLAATSEKVGLVEISNQVFERIPTHPIAHWSPPSIRAAYQNHDSFEPTFGIVRKGLSPGDSDRFVKIWWEVPQYGFRFGRRWLPYANGGSFSPFYRATKEVVDWRTNGEAIRSYCFADGRPRYVIRSMELYGTAGLTFGKRGETLNVQLLPAGQVLSNEGYLILPLEREKTVWQCLAFFNSVPARYLVNMVCGLHKEVGAIKVVPLPIDIISSCAEGLSAHAKRAFDAARELRIEETNPEYYPRPFLRLKQALTIKGLSDSYLSSAALLRSIIASEEKQINKLVACAFALSEAELAALQSDLKLPQEVGSNDLPDSDSESDVINAGGITTELISWTIGVTFGRWDIRYATGEQAAPELPDPFAPLPVCPPGQLQNAQGLPARPEDVPAGYPVRIPWEGILVDDPNHPLDIERRVREVIEIVWSGTATPQPAGGPTAEAIEQEACEILGVKSLRDYFRKPAGFFADHLKRYSKSRRQAPIYWPLSTASGSYTLWIYYHRLTDQTLFQCVNDFVKPKLEEVNRDLERLNAECRVQNGGTAKQREQLEAMGDFAVELKEFHDDLLRVAGLPYKPNLNDGVLITASPLWRLFRLPKWQKDLKACWESLEDGEYDWAHLAYTIWPDRVKEVCKKDRSIAIAHSLEELCEVKAPEKKAKRGKKPANAELKLEGEE